MRAKASILVGLLWCLALLSIAVLSVLHTARMDLLVVKNHGDRIQAHYLALAGIERAKALLYHDSVLRRQTARNHTGALFDDPSHFQDVALGRGRFRVFHDGPDGPVFGVTDEESRLNVNTVSQDVLANIKDLGTDVAGSIINWRAAPTQPGVAGGASADYYASLSPPYRPRNGPFQTVRELLMVRGVEPQLLLGDAGAGDDPEAGDRPLEDGWSALLTVRSTDDNVNAAGKNRVDVQSADQTSLTSVPGLTPAVAQAIIDWRGRNPFQSIADLLDVTSTNTAAPNANSGTSLIDNELLMQIADDISVGSDASAEGLINLNTAGHDVLVCLPGIDETQARSIISYRQSSGFFPNVAWLLKVQGMTRDKFKQLAPRVTTRSETFRLTSEGEVPSSGTRQRIQAVIHVGPAQVQTLSYREDL